MVVKDSFNSCATSGRKYFKKDDNNSTICIQWLADDQGGEAPTTNGFGWVSNKQY